MAGLLYRIPENDLMSLAEPVSKPSPLLTRLAVLLRNIPVVQFVLARLASLRGIPVARGESSEPASLGEQYRSSDRVAPDPSLAALPLVDPTVVRQALNDEPLAAAARDGVDQSAAHAAAADVTLSEPASIERTMDDALVDDPSLAFLLGVDQLALQLAEQGDIVVRHGALQILRPAFSQYGARSFLLKILPESSRGKAALNSTTRGTL